MPTDPPPHPAGQLRIEVGAGRVALGSTRPLAAARVFVGRPIATVIRQLPLIYSLCACAQGIACVRAAEQALGRTAGPLRDATRARLLAAETVKEHLWRLLLDWPRGLGCGAPDGPTMAAVLRGFGAVRAALTPVALTLADASPTAPDITGAAGELHDLAARIAFGMPPADWLARITDPDELAGWAARPAGPPAAALVDRVLRADLAGLGGNGIGPLAGLPGDLARIAQQLAEAAPEPFIAAPTLDGVPLETTPLARRGDWPLVAALLGTHGNGLLARLAALLVDLAEAAGTLVGAAPAPAPAPPATGAPGLGLAAVPAARGLLVHRLLLDGETVADYRILAPTEWNFHPHGVVAAGLAGIAARPAAPGLLRQRATLHITAVDPCVDYALSIS